MKFFSFRTSKALMRIRLRPIRPILCFNFDRMFSCWNNISRQPVNDWVITCRGATWLCHPLTYRMRSCWVISPAKNKIFKMHKPLHGFGWRGCRHITPLAIGYLLHDWRGKSPGINFFCLSLFFSSVNVKTWRKYFSNAPILV